MVLALAGDSTITRFLIITGRLVRIGYVENGHKSNTIIPNSRLQGSTLIYNKIKMSLFNKCVILPSA